MRSSLSHPISIVIPSNLWAYGYIVLPTIFQHISEVIHNFKYSLGIQVKWICGCTTYQGLILAQKYFICASLRIISRGLGKFPIYHPTSVTVTTIFYLNGSVVFSCYLASNDLTTTEWLPPIPNRDDMFIRAFTSSEGFRQLTLRERII